MCNQVEENSYQEDFLAGGRMVAGWGWLGDGAERLRETFIVGVLHCLIKQKVLLNTAEKQDIVSSELCQGRKNHKDKKIEGCLI